MLLTLDSNDLSILKTVIMWSELQRDESFMLRLNATIPHIEVSIDEYEEIISTAQFLRGYVESGDLRQINPEITDETMNVAAANMSIFIRRMEYYAACAF